MSIELELDDCKKILLSQLKAMEAMLGSIKNLSKIADEKFDLFSLEQPLVEFEEQLEIVIKKYDKG